MRIAEVPTVLHHATDTHRTAHLRTWRDGWRHLVLMSVLSPRWLFLYPGCILFSMGGLIATVALTDTAENRFGEYTLIFGLGAMTGGLQIVVFSLIAKVFYERIGLAVETRWLNRLQQYRTLAMSLLLGLLLLLLGGIGSAWSFFILTQLVESDYEIRRRVLAVSIMLMVAGLQIIFSSFLLTLLATQKPFKN